MALKIQRVLVTGGGGLLGSHLLKRLAGKGHKITALYRNSFPNELLPDNITWLKADVLDVPALYDAMVGVQQVYHCAAVVSFNPKHTANMFNINIEGTANVVNAALNAGVDKLVFASSVAALGRIRKEGAINETMNWSQKTSNSKYGQSKYLAEMEVWRGIGEGLNAVMVNPAIILGRADWNKGSAGIFKSAYNEFPWYSTGGGGFVDVLDVVEAMVLLMNSQLTAQRFIVSAENRSYREVFNLMANSFGKKPPHKKVTPLLSSLVWRMEAIKSAVSKSNPLLTRETANTAMTAVQFDNSKLLKAFPQFKYQPLEATIQRVCKELLALLPPL